MKFSFRASILPTLRMELGVGTWWHSHVFVFLGFLLSCRCRSYSSSVMFKLSSANSYCKCLALAGWGDLLAHSRKETSIDQISWFVRSYVSCGKNFSLDRWYVCQEIWKSNAVTRKFFILLNYVSQGYFLNLKP